MLLRRSVPLHRSNIYRTGRARFAQRPFTAQSLSIRPSADVRPARVQSLNSASTIRPPPAALARYMARSAQASSTPAARPCTGDRASPMLRLGRRMASPTAAGRWRAASRRPPSATDTVTEPREVGQDRGELVAAPTAHRVDATQRRHHSPPDQAQEAVACRVAVVLLHGSAVRTH